MIKSRAIRASILVACTWFSGCHPASPPEQPQTSTSIRRDRPSGATSPIAVTPQPQSQSQKDASAEPPTPGTAQALAQRAATYAQTVQPLVAKHTLFTSESGDWPDPDAMHLTAKQPVVEGGAGPAPQAAVVANTGLTVNAPGGDKPFQNFVPSKPPESRAIAPANSDALSARLSKRARDYPSDLSAQIDDQLLKFLRDDPVPDMQSLSGLPPEDRELLSALMDCLTNLRSQMRADNNMLFSKKMAPLIDMGDRLRSQAELSVPTVALCTTVQAFGEYAPIDPARFVAGKPHQVGLYYEVENFSSQPNGEKLYETRLSEEIVLYTESSGLPVWSDRKETYTDRSRRRRHDFFVGKRITLPATLTIGRYLLKVTIQDEQARRIAENTVPVEIVAQ